MGLLTLMLTVTGLLLAVGAVQLVATGSTSVAVAGIGEPRCVQASTSEIGDGASAAAGRGLSNLRRDVASARPEQWRVWLDHPTAWQRIAAVTGPLGQFLFIVTALLMMRRVIRGARRNGLFSPEAARCTRQLGHFLLVAWLAGPFVGAAARGVVVSGAFDVSGSGLLDEPGIPWALVVTALGVLAFARILCRAVPLQADVDATR